MQNYSVVVVVIYLAFTLTCRAEISRVFALSCKINYPTAGRSRAELSTVCSVLCSNSVFLCCRGELTDAVAGSCRPRLCAVMRSDPCILALPQRFLRMSVGNLRVAFNFSREVLQPFLTQCFAAWSGCQLKPGLVQHALHLTS